MCAAVVEHVAVDADVRAERRRILVTLLNGLDELSERGVVALRAEIPAYHDGDGRFVEDLRDQVRSHYRVRPRGGDAPRARASRWRTTSTPSASASRPSGRRSWSARETRGWVRRPR